MHKRTHFDRTPEVNAFPGSPDSCFDLVNQFGTYNIQPTADADNLFPLIAPGLPRRWSRLRLDRHDVERQQGRPE